MRTLVTGATGLVGNNLVRLLLARGEEVRVLVRPGCDPRPLRQLDVERVRGDVRDPSAVEASLRHVELVLHAAGYVHIGWSARDLHFEVNVEGTRCVAQAALEAGVRMVHVSSVDALCGGTQDDPGTEDRHSEDRVPCPYVVTKRVGEEAVLDLVGRGLDAVIVNPGFMLGPWDWKPSSGRMLLAVARGWALIAPPGGSDFCDARDVAAGILSAAERGRAGARYILGGHARSYLQAWRLFARISGAVQPIMAARRWSIGLAGAVGDIMGRILRREPDLNSAATRMAIAPHHYSSARAIAELGYEYRPLEATVADAWAWFQEQGYVPAAGLRGGAVRLGRAR